MAPEPLTCSLLLSISAPPQRATSVPVLQQQLQLARAPPPLAQQATVDLPLPQCARPLVSGPLPELAQVRNMAETADEEMYLVVASIAFIDKTLILIPSICNPVLPTQHLPSLVHISSSDALKMCRILAVVSCIVPTGYQCGSVSGGSSTITCASPSCAAGYDGSPAGGSTSGCTTGTGSWSLSGCSGRRSLECVVIACYFYLLHRTCCIAECVQLTQDNA